jgi:hypothetical protein
MSRLVFNDLPVDYLIFLFSDLSWSINIFDNLSSAFITVASGNADTSGDHLKRSPLQS